MVSHFNLIIRLGLKPVIEDHMIVGYDFRFLLPTHCLHYDARDLIYDRKWFTILITLVQEVKLFYLVSNFQNELDWTFCRNVCILVSPELVGEVLRRFRTPTGRLVRPHVRLPRHRFDRRR